jgi:diaminopimelate epimerase
MLVRFTKMHGIGNDFVLLDFISQNIHLNEEQIRVLANRRTGIGFDQLLIVEPPRNPDMDFRYRIFNADGSEAQQCGNGARCFTRFVRDRGLTTKTSLMIETSNGCLECKLLKDGNISVNMGAPLLEPSRIPFKADQPAITYQLQLHGQKKQASYSETTVELAVVSMGNPHAVIIVEDIKRAPVIQLGPMIQSHSSFPDKVNVGFMQIVNRTNVKLRVYERGVGETLACGSGACAAVVAGRLQGLLDADVKVELAGGILDVTWKGDQNPVILTGPACRVYEGHLQI